MSPAERLFYISEIHAAFESAGLAKPFVEASYGDEHGRHNSFRINGRYVLRHLLSINVAQIFNRNDKDYAVCQTYDETYDGNPYPCETAPLKDVFHDGLKLLMQHVLTETKNEQGNCQDRPVTQRG